MQTLSRQIKRGNTVFVRNPVTGAVTPEKPTGRNKKYRLSDEQHDAYRASVAIRAAEDKKAALEAQEAKKRRRAK